MFVMFSLFELFAFEMMFAFGAGMSAYLFSEVSGLRPEEESFFENFFGHSIEWFVVLFNNKSFIQNSRPSVWMIQGTERIKKFLVDKIAKILTLQKDPDYLFKQFW